LQLTKLTAQSRSLEGVRRVLRDGAQRFVLIACNGLNFGSKVRW
jgi:hypothetical protein